MSLPRWRGHVIFTAPGDFPERLGLDMNTNALSIEDAITFLKARANQMGLDPEVTQIERITPPWSDRS